MSTKVYNNRTSGVIWEVAKVLKTSPYKKETLESKKSLIKTAWVEATRDPLMMGSTFMGGLTLAKLSRSGIASFSGDDFNLKSSLIPALGSLGLFVLDKLVPAEVENPSLPPIQPVEQSENKATVKNPSDETRSIAQKLIKNILSNDKLSDTLKKVYNNKKMRSREALTISSSGIDLISTESGFYLVAVEENSAKQKMTLKISLNELITSAFENGSSHDITVKVITNSSTSDNPHEISLPISLTAAA